VRVKLKLVRGQKMPRNGELLYGSRITGIDGWISQRRAIVLDEPLTVE